MDDLAFDMALLDESALDMTLFDAVFGGAAATTADDASTALAPSDTSPDLDDTASLESLLSSLSDSDTSEPASDCSTTSTTDAVRIAPPTASALTQQSPLQVYIRLPQQPDTATQTTQQAGVRVAPVTAPLKRPRKHNRTEILALREQVTQLEVRLAELQRLRDGGGCNVSEAREPHDLLQQAPRSPWFLMASAQILKLRQAQALNRVLRDAVVKQHHASNAVQVRLQKQSGCCFFQSSTPFTGRASGGDNDVTASSTTSTPSSGDPLAVALPGLFEAAASKIHEIDLVAHTASAPSGAAHSVTNTSRASWDVVRGWAFEVTTCTPIVGHYEANAQLLWTRIVNNGNCSEQRAPPLPFAVSHMKHLTVGFCSRDGRDVVLHGALVVRKFEQARRTVLTVTAAYVLDGCDLLFREEGWSIIAAADVLSSSPSPSPSTAMQTFYRLYSERQDATSASGSAPFTQPLDALTQRTQETVVKGLGEKMRDHLAELQGLLVQAADATSFRTLEINDCPLISAPC